MIDWTFIYNGLTVGGSGNPYNLIKINGFHDAPDVRTADTERARAHGMFAGTDYLGGRSITAEIEVVAPHPDEADWSAFSRAFVPGDTAESTLKAQIPGVAGGIEVQVGARVRRLALPIDRDYLFGHGSAMVEFFCTDPRIYSVAQTLVSIDQAAISGSGLTFPATFPLSFGGAVSGGLGVATNAGEFSAPWVGTITGPVDNPRIENVATGQVLSFTGSLSAGQTLVISSLDRSVLLSGTASRYSWLNFGSSWFDLAPGTNTIRFAGTAGTGNLQLTFRSVWI